MILAQAVSQIFCSQGSIGLQSKSRKRGIKILSLTVLDHMQSIKDAHTHVLMDEHLLGISTVNFYPTIKRIANTTPLNFVG